MTKKFCLLWFANFFEEFSAYFVFNERIFVKKRLKISLEPDSNQWPKDVCIFRLQSSALPTELSRGWKIWEQFTVFEYSVPSLNSLAMIFKSIFLTNSELPSKAILILINFHLFWEAKFQICWKFHPQKYFWKWLFRFGSLYFSIK